MAASMSCPSCDSMRALVVLGTLAASAPAVSAQVAVRDPDDSRAGSSLSAGGEVRQEYEWFDNEEWGAEVPDHNGYWLQRYMLHVDTRLSRRVRLYGELKSGIEAGRAGGPRSSDEDRLDLHQAFVDVSFGPRDRAGGAAGTRVWVAAAGLFPRRTEHAPKL